MKYSARFAVAGLSLIAAILVQPVGAQEKALKRTAVEKSLGKFDLSQIDVKRGLWISRDGRRAAWMTQDKKGVVVDGKLFEFKYPNRLRHFEFSPDSQHFAFSALGEKGEAAFLDGVPPAKGYNTVSPGPVFSPDSKHIAYIARLSASEFTTTLVVDDKEIGPPNKESSAWNLTFTGDNKKVLFGTEVDKKYQMREVSIDGSEPVSEFKHGPALLTIPFLRGPEGQLGYVAKDEGGHFVFYNGKDDKHRFKEIQAIAVSRDGKRIAYAAEPETFRSVVVIDGVKGKVFKDLVKGSLCFSPDGKRTAYATRDFSRFTPVIDGQEGKVYRGADAIVFSPDSKRVAYRAIGDKAMIVVDGKEGAGYDAIGRPVFSPDSKQVAVSVTLGKREFLLINGQPDKKAYDEVGEPAYSADGKRLVYLAKAGDKWRVVDSGKELKPYDEIREDFYFSPDGRFLATIVLDGDKQMVVVNGQEGPRVDTILILGGAKVHFGEGKLHYLATKEGELILVEETLE